MTDHPLTDDFCHRIAESWPPDAAERNNMRSAADWQLEQVMQWLDENLTTYINSAYWGEWQHINALESHLKEAMRPTTTTTQEDNS